MNPHHKFRVGPGTCMALLPLALFMVAGVHAEEPAAAMAHDFSPGQVAAQAVQPLAFGKPRLAALLTADPGAGDLASPAPASELATHLDVRLERSRRKFRTRAIDWVKDRSLAVGYLADFIIDGGDSGWHLDVDLRGEDEYMLQWKARFR